MSASEIILDSKHKVIPITGEEDEHQRRLMKGHKCGTIRLQPGGWYFNSFFPKFANKLYNFKYRSSDVIIMTNPKCGTTWTQEIVWTMRNNPNLDNPKATAVIQSRVPMIDCDHAMESEEFTVVKQSIIKEAKLPVSVLDEGISLHCVTNLPNPRTIKTHLPISLMPPNILSTSKVIYVTRNPKAACVSYYHYHRLYTHHDFVGSFDEYIELVMNNAILYNPFIPHVVEAWNQRSHENLLFLFYEDMIADPLKEYRRIDRFLETNLTENQINNIVAYTEFFQMKNRGNIFRDDDSEKSMMNKDIFEKYGGFFRKGKANDWKSMMTVEQIEKMDKWITEHTLGTDLKFK